MEINEQTMIKELCSLSADQLTALLELAQQKKQTAGKTGREASSGNVGFAAAADAGKAGTAGAGSMGSAAGAETPANPEKPANAASPENRRAQEAADAQAALSVRAVSGAGAGIGSRAAADEALDWDGELEDDGGEYIVLKEGDYSFTITGCERGRFPGSAKLPACNKVTIRMTVRTPEGDAHVKTDLILCRSLEWKLSSFFRCIGQKKKGQRMVMNWSKVEGSRGRAHFSPRSYVGSDGRPREVNDCDRFYDYDEQYFNCGEPELIPLPDDTALPF